MLNDTVKTQILNIFENLRNQGKTEMVVSNTSSLVQQSYPWLAKVVADKVTVFSVFLDNQDKPVIVQPRIMTNESGVGCLIFPDGYAIPTKPLSVVLNICELREGKYGDKYANISAIIEWEVEEESISCVFPIRLAKETLDKVSNSNDLRSLINKQVKGAKAPDLAVFKQGGSYETLKKLTELPAGFFTQNLEVHMTTGKFTKHYIIIEGEKYALSKKQAAYVEQLGQYDRYTLHIPQDSTLKTVTYSEKEYQVWDKMSFFREIDLCEIEEYC